MKPDDGQSQPDCAFRVEHRGGDVRDGEALVVAELEQEVVVWVKGLRPRTRAAAGADGYGIPAVAARRLGRRGNGRGRWR